MNFNHLKEVNETWWQHFCFAFPMGCRLVWGGIKIGIHAFIPFILVDDGSKCIRKCHSILEEKFPDQEKLKRKVQV